MFNYVIKHILKDTQETYDINEIGTWLGIVSIYKANHDQDLKEAVLVYLDRLMESEFYQPDKFRLEQCCLGMLFCFALQETGQEQYRKALSDLRKELEYYPRNQNGLFADKEGIPPLIDFYMSQPFYLKYETLYNNKEKYNDIISQYQNLHKMIFGEGYSTRDMPTDLCWYVVSVIDGFSIMDEQVFEHYKTLELIFKQTIKYLIQNQHTLNTLSRILLSYAILKGCRLEALIDEKYASVALHIYKASIESLDFDYALSKDLVLIRAYLLLYSEIIWRK